ncbi:TPA: hypothetical protein QDB15_002443 [Burkholderia vietnamiensis]|uniref:hypothetical protein n=1 Tax=Burkholderia vietnamiensis TaxID=60552 RepID=UPI00159370EA|nr:hypothetical protein [Burkholderia vietnamiensis]MCA8208244.1 hypothetical protein [Burkholderia vietnamiensis]HDR9102821.1 hypothetical protein [Burkholderia vietnamiensis]HDR9118668.1 hypothetical protein [Burkholderia vietnamiensis]HDR9167857.1 hypothetical protein [Burkholderia vietnamiensis]
MYIYDYRYVITCSSLSGLFKHEFRKLVRGRIGRQLDPRTGALYSIPEEKQCRPVAVLLHGFQTLRKGGYALQSPWSLQGKHLRYLLEHWSREGIDASELAARIGHWRVFVKWIGKHALLAQLEWRAPVAGTGMGQSPPSSGQPVAPIDIPVLTREKVMAVLVAHRGNLHKTAHALGTSTRMACLALTEGRPRPNVPASSSCPTLPTGSPRGVEPT